MRKIITCNQFWCLDEGSGGYRFSYQRNYKVDSQIFFNSLLLKMIMIYYAMKMPYLFWQEFLYVWILSFGFSSFYGWLWNQYFCFVLFSNVVIIFLQVKFYQELWVHLLALLSILVTLLWSHCVICYCMAFFPAMVRSHLLKYRVSSNFELYCRYYTLKGTSVLFTLEMKCLKDMEERGKRKEEGLLCLWDTGAGEHSWCTLNSSYSCLIVHVDSHWIPCVTTH